MNFLFFFSTYLFSSQFSFLVLPSTVVQQQTYIRIHNFLSFFLVNFFIVSFFFFAYATFSYPLDFWFRFLTDSFFPFFITSTDSHVLRKNDDCVVFGFFLPPGELIMVLLYSLCECGCVCVKDVHITYYTQLNFLFLFHWESCLFVCSFFFLSFFFCALKRTLTAAKWWWFLADWWFLSCVLFISVRSLTVDVVVVFVKILFLFVCLHESITHARRRCALCCCFLETGQKK